MALTRYKFFSALLLIFTALNAQADLGFSFSSYGDTKCTYRLNEFSYNVQVQWDTTSNFDSENLKTKNLTFWYDTIEGLKLGKTYAFRARYIKGPNSFGPWTTQHNYSTTNYPFALLFGLDYLATNTSPKYTYSASSAVRTEIEVDSTPNFNSVNLKKYIFNPSIYTHDFKWVNNNEVFYLKTRVMSETDTLEWLVQKVTNKFSPRANFYTYQCVNGETKCQLSVSNFIQGSDSFKNRFIVLSKNGTDTITDNFFNREFWLNFNDSVQLITNVNFYKNDETYFYNDSITYYLNIQNYKPNLRLTGNPNTPFQITNLFCEASVEIELFEDSTLNNLLEIKTFFDTFNIRSILFNLEKWEPIVPQVFRYRVFNDSIVGEWLYYNNESFTPIIFYNSTSSDSLNANWTITKPLYSDSYDLIIELDKTNQFNSEKLKTFTIKDQSSFTLSSLLEPYTYARIKLKKGNIESNYSNVVRKQGVDNYIPGTSIKADVPTLTFYRGSYVQLDGFEVRLYHQKDSLIVPNMLTIQLSQTPFQVGNTVYFKNKRYTEIDTSEWSPIRFAVIKNPNKTCLHPVVQRLFTKDSIKISWNTPDVDNNEGYYFLFGPNPGEIYGYESIDSSTNRISKSLADYPSDWYFAVISKCNFYRPGKGISTPWQSFSPSITKISSFKNKQLISYEQHGQVLTNHSDKDIDALCYAINGQLIKTLKLQAKGSSALLGMNPGAYIIVVRNNSSFKTLKLIIP